MSSTKPRMADAGTQTDIGNPTTPPTPPSDGNPATNNEAGTRLPRLERRQKWWAPIGAKIRDRQEARQSTQAAGGVSAVDGTNGTSFQGKAAQAGAPPYNSPAHGRQDHGRSQGRGQVFDGHGYAPAYPQARPPLRHSEGAQHHGLSRNSNGLHNRQPHQRGPIPPEAPGPSRAFMHNLRGQDRPSLVDAWHHGHPRQPHEQSPSSATHVEDTDQPIVTITSVDDHGQSAPTKLLPDQEEVARTTFGAAPPSPYIPSLTQLHIDEGWEPAGERTSCPLLVAYPGSSGSAPRLPQSDWDGKTQVPDLPERPDPRNAADSGLPSIEKSLEMLLNKMKEPKCVSVDRSWTFPGMTSCFQFGAAGYSEDAKSLGGSTTLVEEPVEILPKTDSVHMEGLRPVKSVENFLSVPAGTPWVP